MISGITIYLVDGVVGLTVLCVSMSLGKLLTDYRRDYQPIASLFKATENSVGFNAIFRIAFAPIVIVCVSILLYYAHLDFLVKNIWTVAVWYFVLQALLIVLLGRWRLLNRFQFFLYHAISIFLSLYLYQTLIVNGLTYLLPDEAHLRTEIWLVIVAFLYGIFRSIPQNEQTFSRRKHAYIQAREKAFEKRYANELASYDKLMQEILLSIMIYESFNRPRIVRAFENILKTESRGVMQFTNAQNNHESIKMASAQLKEGHEKLKGIPEENPNFYQTLCNLFRSYNPHDIRYPGEVGEVFKVIHGQ